MIIKKGLIWMWIGCLLATAGCWDYRELNELGFVMAIGVDQAEKGNYRVSFQLLNPGVMAQGWTNPATVTMVYSETGHTLYEAIRKATQKTSRRMFFAHMQVFILSEEVARMGRGSGTFLDYIERHPEVPENIPVLIARKGKAEQVVSTLSSMEQISANEIKKKTQLAKKKWGENIHVTVDELIDLLSGEGKEVALSGLQFIGPPDAVGKQIELKQTNAQGETKISGIALFKNGRLRRWVDGATASGAAFLLNHMDSTALNVNCGKQKDRLSVVLHHSKTHLSAEINRGKPVLRARITSEGKVGEADCPIDLENPNIMGELEKYASRKIESEVGKAIRVAQREKSDVFGFGQALYRSDPANVEAVEEELGGTFRKGRRECPGGHLSSAYRFGNQPDFKPCEVSKGVHSRMEKAKISPFQLFCLVFLFELGSSAIVGIGSNAKQDAWIAILIALAAGMLLFLVYGALFRLYPDRPLTGYARRIFGHGIGWLAGLLYVVYFTYISARVLRDICGLISTTWLNETPVVIVSILLIFVMVFMIHQGIEVTAKTGEIYFFVYAGSILVGLMAVICSGAINVNQLHPAGEDWGKILTTAFPMVYTFPFGEMIVFTMFLPYVNKPKSAFRAGLLAMGISGLVLALIIVIDISALGPKIVGRAPFPLLLTFSKVEIKFFLPRLDMLAAVILIVGGFFKVALFFFAAVMGAADLCRMKHNRLILPFGVIILYLSMVIAGNFSEHLKEGLELVPWYLHLPMQTGIPLLLLGIGWARTRSSVRRQT